ncbi:MAG: hypothetical protein HRU15_09665, partial [Planctomycetes bacterium]|nr:hypothetical protein [Planctomycetota bacterium]
YNKKNGGVIRNAGEMFNNRRAIALQLRHRRYLVGRYADHPAILCWKLWTEINLTQGSRYDLKNWHQAAFKSWQKLDAYYQHPCATHWSSDYNTPDRELVQLHEMDVVAIDAYHRGGGLPNLLYNSTLHPQRGLAQYKKPIVVTEFGGNWDACPLPQLAAEHATGAWCALMSGHGSAPHLWWFEWVDQQDRWRPFQSISNFIKGEDLRGSRARTVKLNVRNAINYASQRDFWAYAWAKPGCVLGYILDSSWADRGLSPRLFTKHHVIISSAARAGQMQLEWWDAQIGTVISRELIAHKGGVLKLQVPDFRRHIAFKLKRLSTR